LSIGSTAPNASTAQARVLVDELARGGLTDVVLCPGSRSAPFAFAFDADPRIRLHVHPDERSAAFVALGLALATDRPAAVVVTSGSAVAELHPAVLEADAAGVPLLLLTADRPPELRETGADQTVRQPGIFGSAVRWAVDLGVAEDRADAVATWRASAARALAEARGLSGPAGPVQLNVPFREPTVPATDDGRTAAVPFTTPLMIRGTTGIEGAHVVTTTAPRRSDDDTIAQLAVRFAAVERGVLLVGSGAQDAVTADAVHALAAVTGWPVLAEGHAAARHRDGALSAWPHLLEHERFRDTHRPDLIVRLGRTTLTRAVGAWAARSHELLIDAHGRWWDPGRRMGELLVADPVDTLTRVAAELAMSAGSAWGDAWRTADAAVATALDEYLDAGGGHAAARTVRSVIAAAPLGAHVVVASSMAVRHLDRHAPQRPDLTWHANRGVAGIDGAVSTALGVALGVGSTNGAPVIAIVGDVALLHDTNGWLLAPDAPAEDLTVVVLDDDGGTIFDLLPAGAFPAQRRLFATPHGRDLARVAALHDVPCAAVDLRSDGPTVASARSVLDALGGTPGGRGRRMIRVLVHPLDRSEPARTSAVVSAALVDGADPTGRSGPPAGSAE
jgi:2-succinyl-5-enolpyruvyl-6-hydroxy-3-cyclohexene-1-carboxylate synthase